MLKELCEFLDSNCDNVLNEKCTLPLFIKAVEFIKGKAGFGTAELQKHLCCSYHDLISVIDALEILSAIKKNEDNAIPYNYVCAEYN